MPTDKNRVNLTIPDNVYERITRFREKNSIPSDAGACLQLIQRQLDSIEQMEEMMKMVRRFTPEELRQINDIGMDQLTQLLDATNSSKPD